MQLRCIIKRQGGSYAGTCLEFNLGAKGVNMEGCRAALIEIIERHLATAFELYYREGVSINPIPVKNYPLRRFCFDCVHRWALRFQGSGRPPKSTFTVEVAIPGA